MHAKLFRGTVQVKHKLIHAHATGHTVEARTLRGHHTHRASWLDHMLRAFHIKTGSGTVNAVRIADRHDRGGRIGRSQVRAAIGNAMARFNILDRTKLRLQRHGRRQTVCTWRAHGRISLITIQADTRARQLKMNLGT